jgi:hypothetical protein
VVLVTWLREEWRRAVPVAVAAVACATGVAIAILPMALYAVNPANGYFQSFDLVSSLTKPAYQQLPNVWDRAAYLGSRYILFWDRLCCHPALDTIDGTGQTAIVPPLQLGISLIGFLVLMRWWRHPLALLTIVMMVLAPVGSVVTLDGPARRVFEIVPFIAFATALGAYPVLRTAYRYRRLIRIAASSLVAIVFGVVVYSNLYDYFGVFANSPAGDRWVFAQELTDAALYMAALPRGTHVYFYSDRWGVQYETTRFLAQNVISEDRSQEFSPRHVTDTSLTVRPAVFVLIGEYRRLIDELQSRYPGGETTYGGPRDDPTFIAYQPPSS